jgi:glycosidase
MKAISSILCLLFSVLGFAQMSANTAPEWSKNATIYEVNIRQFTKEGTFSAFQKHLPRLKAMGVDILWLMPIHPIGEKNRKGSLGSYYAVKDYKAVNPEFGNLQDFNALVKSAHDLGMKLIIDWVANHTSPDNVWVDQGHKDWYTLDSTGNLQPTIGTDWWDVADLNFDNQNMRTEMIESMKYWLTASNIDGFRCDVAGWVPLDFWVTAKQELDKVKPIFFLAESEGPEQHQAFHMTYAWELHHLMNKIAQGKENIDVLRAYLEKDKSYPTSAYRMSFTSNHDENSWNGTEMERMGEARFAMAVMAATIEGMPLVYNGQETSLDRRLAFFEKDEIDWTKMDLVSFYDKLLHLHQKT